MAANIYEKRYQVACKLFDQQPKLCIEAAKRNIVDRSAPADYFIKNCILIVRALPRWDEAFIWKQAAEEMYTKAIEETSPGQDAALLEALKGLRAELDEVDHSRKEEIDDYYRRKEERDNSGRVRGQCMETEDGEIVGLPENHVAAAMIRDLMFHYLASKGEGVDWYDEIEPIRAGEGAGCDTESEDSGEARVPKTNWQRQIRTKDALEMDFAWLHTMMEYLPEIYQARYRSTLCKWQVYTDNILTAIEEAQGSSESPEEEQSDEEQSDEEQSEGEQSEDEQSDDERSEDAFSASTKQDPTDDETAAKMADLSIDAENLRSTLSTLY